MPSLPVRILLSLLALAGPIVVLGAAFAWYNRAEPWAPSKQVALFDTAAKVPAEVVVLGSSWAETNVDAVELAKSLDIPVKKIITLSQAKSFPAIWYAIAKYRLYGNPASHPRLLVVVTGIQGLLVTRPDPKELADLEQHYEQPDEVLLAKAYGIQSAPWVARVLSRRPEPRDRVLAWIRQQAVDLLFDPPEGQTIADMQAAAADEVFAAIEGNGDARLERFLPVVEKDDTPAAGVGGNIAQNAAETFLGDLAALAQEHDARLVVVVPPVASFQRTRQTAAPALERDLVDFANAHQIGWLDMRDREIEDRGFRADGGHMTATGATAFTRLLGPELVRIGALGEGELVQARAQARLEAAERTGTIPELVAGTIKPLKEKCFWGVDLSAYADLAAMTVRDRAGVVSTPVQALLRGEVIPSRGPPKLKEHPCEAGWAMAGKTSRLMLPEDVAATDLSFRLDPALPDLEERRSSTWWVYPGSGVRWSVEDTDGAGTVSVSVAARAATAASGKIELRVGDQAVPLQPGAEGLEAKVEVSLPAGPRVIELRVAPDGPYTVVRRLVVEQKESHAELIRPPAQKVADALGGELTVGPPPPVTGKLEHHAKRGSSYQVSWTNEVKCSPFVVTQDGTPLPPTAAANDGGVAYIKDRVLFRGTGGVDPATEPGRFALGFEPSHICPIKACSGCPRRIWLYPGDHLSTSLAVEGRKKVIAPVELLHVTGELLPPAAEGAMVHLVARFHDRVIADQTFPLSALPTGLPVTLDEPVPLGDTAPLVIELDLAADATPVLVTMRAMSL